MEQMFPLAQALEKFSDPEILSRFDKVEGICRKQKWVGRRFGGIALFIGKPPRGYQKAKADLEATERALIDPFLDKLRAGALVAAGTPSPATPDTSEVIITTAQWHFLKPLFTTYESVAAGGGLRFVGVRIGLRPETSQPFFGSPQQNRNSIGEKDNPSSTTPGPRSQKEAMRSTLITLKSAPDSSPFKTKMAAYHAVLKKLEIKNTPRGWAYRTFVEHTKDLLEELPE
jgi:hypothetical protein